MFTKLENLCKPFAIGKMTLRNRMVMTSMGTRLASPEGFVTQRQKDYYEARARGGVGLVIVESLCVDFPIGRHSFHELSVDDDKYVDGLSELVRLIKKHGAAAAAQLIHAGGATTTAFAGAQPVAPSAINAPLGEMPRELTTKEIANIIERFAKGAARAKKIGFEGLEIHAAHGYLLAGFLSLSSNQRQDDYGGPLKNRARILLEILRAVKEATGQDYPVWCRINGSQYGMENGLTLAEAQEIARMCQDSGADAIHVSAYGHGAHATVTLPDTPGALVPLAQGVKSAVSIPVIAVGKITPELGEKVLKDKSADLIAMGRALIADPYLPHKVQTGQLGDIRPCIDCLRCISRVEKDEPVGCSVNAAVGEGEGYEVKPAKQSKKVCVIGGGPAGMEVARVAKLRGHEVVLYEQARRLGGIANLAAVVEDPIEPLVLWLPAQIKKLGIKVVLGKAADAALIEALKPDVVILAAGGKPVITPIPGMDRANVVTTLDLKNMVMGYLKWGDIKKKAAYQRMFWWGGNSFARFLKPSLMRRVTRLWLPFGKSVVVIGGDRPGLETARFLAARGRKVTIVDTSKRMGLDMDILPRVRIITHLRQKGVVLVTGVKYEAITDRGLVATTKEGRQTFTADTIALIAGAEPNVELFNRLKGQVPQLYQVGDGAEPGRIFDAINNGFRIASEI